ncbi:MAG: hypothetical protein COU65_00765 [Candidatus Pacebacteria bacterium CG10_big_fil_rev_8_21_14_0_10_42_12]|nr:MAG: hypothetical protein COU65_00765 [Candidatus Pacebacteria bacterium CG10_big_fil_rev_8_21_14_0_10_42_12]
MSLRPWLIFWLLLLCSIFLYLITAQEARAQVFISEIYPNPNSGESEWIEIYNSSTQSADLSGFSLYDTLSQPSLLVRFSDLIIAPLTSYVATISGSKLNNTGDTVIFYDSQQATASAMSYESSEKGLSWNLTSLFDSSIYLATPSAGIFVAKEVVVEIEEPESASESAETPAATQTEPIDTSKITLSEIMACPNTGNLEWIELFSEKDITLENWILTDKSGNTRNLSGEIDANSYGVFEWSSSILNNSGDEFSIVTNIGQLVAEAKYEECKVGKSLVFLNNEWQPSEPSPGSENIALSSEEKNTTTAAVQKKTLAPTTETKTPTANENPKILGSTHKVIRPYYKSSSIELLPENKINNNDRAKMTPKPPSQSSEPFPHVILGGFLVSLSSWLARK